MELLQKIKATLLRRDTVPRHADGTPLSLADVTAVLITKLPEYPKEILMQGFGEIIIRTNCPNILERYVQAGKAKNDIIYVQDDDCIVDYKELFKHYNGRITNAMVGRAKYYHDVSEGRITLVGWGAFFPKSMLDSLQTYIDRYGMDDPHIMRETDRIFTWLNAPHNTIRLPHLDLNQSVVTGRMSADPKHFEYVKEVVVKLKAITAPNRPWDFLERILEKLR